MIIGIACGPYVESIQPIGRRPESSNMNQSYDDNELPQTNSVTKDMITSILSEAETQEHVFWDKELVVSYRLKSGFTILGRAAVVDPANFNLELGRKIAYDDAFKQLWPLEGYMLQNRLYQDTLTESA